MVVMAVKGRRTVVMAMKGTVVALGMNPKDETTLLLNNAHTIREPASLLCNDPPTYIWC